MSDTPTATLVCPQCRGAMRSYERNGITIEQCQDCRGVFLDRGELERLIDAEGQDYLAAAGANDPRTRDQPDFRPSYDDGHHSDTGHRSKQGGRRRRSFLGDLFD